MLRLSVGLLLALAAPAAAAFPAGGVADLRTQADVAVLGASTYDGVAGSVGPAGDVNGDGLDDVLLGAPEAARSRGAVYVLLGHRPGRPARGFKISGTVRGARVGQAVAPVGDVNGDGRDDIAIGAPWSGDGALYVVFGRRATTPIRLDRLGRAGLTLIGTDPGSMLGTGVTGGRDVDGDGRPDVVVGAGPKEVGGVQATHVIRGSSRRGRLAAPDLTLPGAGGAVALVPDMDGDRRWDIVTTVAPGLGVRARVFLGLRRSFDVSGPVSHALVPAVAGADVDGDGRGDVLIAADDSVLLVRGKADTEPVTATVAARGPGRFGWSLASVGDLTGDGVDDVLVGAPDRSPRGRAKAGAAFLLAGSRGGGLAPPFRFDGERPGDALGKAVGGAGDFNGDGKRDLLLGGPEASRADRTFNGVGYVVYGR